MCVCAFVCVQILFKSLSAPNTWKWMQTFTYGVEKTTNIYTTADRCSKNIHSTEK